jgi:aspartyl-tRNA(Asn)/glutamyl-tRNA(Gln) amidotransferase subunit A
VSIGNLDGLDYHSIRGLLDKGKLSCNDLVEDYLNQIDAKKDLNAFISVFPEKARSRAEEVNKKIRAGKGGRLAGLVIAIKDILAIKDEKVTCGSRILSNFVSPFNATAIDKLLWEDAIIIGKTNLDEFGMGSSSENSYFGQVKNPNDRNRIPGGSSGGSAAAVAASMASAALGTDTGGSVRQPAAMCGVVGLKPSYGRVSRYGLVAFASSLDQVGPITRSVKDAALLLSVIAGHDDHDSTSAALDVPDYFANIDRGVAGLSIGYPREYFTEGLSAEVSESIQRALKILENGGAKVEEISLPHTECAISAYYILATAEASANLARYDGAHHGFRADGITELSDMYEQSRSQGFGEEVKRRIMLGTYVLSAGYYEAYYRKAQKVRTLIKRDFDKVFDRYGCIVTPTAPTTAFKIGEKLDDPLQMYLSDIYTISANLAGIHGMSIPCGKDSENLPIGVQLLGQSFNESTTFRIGQYLQEELVN